MVTRGTVTAVILVLGASPAGLAAAQEGGTSVFSLDLGLAVWTLVLFLMTLTILVWKVFPWIAGGLEERQARIQQAIDDARQDREEARRLLEEQREQLREARQEARALVEEGREAGERLRKEILEEAREEQEKMLERARREMERERDRLRQEVRQEAVDVALAAASRLVRERLDAERDRALVREFVAELEAG